MFKSFISKYSTICTFSIIMQFSYANISQSFASNQLKKSICFSYAFRANISNIETRIGEDGTNQNRCFDSDLRNLDFNAGFPPHQPLFKYIDNHILVDYSRSFLSGFMSIRYPFTCKIFWGHMSHILLMLPSIKL